MAEGYGQDSKRVYVQAFFKRLGARFGRIRKRPRGKPSPQLYERKVEKLQELECLEAKGLIDLFFADESHVCTQGYVPYGWKFRDEDVYIPSQKAGRLNIFGMTSRDNVYHGFHTTESINADRFVRFMDDFSLWVTRKTVVVLDNSSVHRNRKVMAQRQAWENRGLFLFFLPPYSPHLNIAETLWRVLKTKWIRPQDYISTDNLFYAADRALAALGKGVAIKHRHKVI